jgi:hypothetical protein
MDTRTTLLVTLITLLCASMALAAPTRLSQQGRLLDGDGTPLTGGHGLAFTLHDAETDGNEVWREERVVEFEEGYYSIILGTVTPLDDLLFSGSTVWLQLSVDGVELSPRQEVVSVPYALRATSAEHVDGGVVEAAEISVGGVPVINSTGAWIGPTPNIDWSYLTGVPPDIADGDQNTDTLADLGLSCANGEVARFQDPPAIWSCDAETVTTSLPWGAITGVPSDIADGDQDTITTTLDWTAIIGIPADIADGDQDTITTTLDWIAITGIPADIADGDQDTNTQLTDLQVDDFASNGPLDLSSGTTLGGQTISVGAHTTNTDQLSALQCNADEMIQFDASSGSWGCIEHIGNPDSHHSPIEGVPSGMVGFFAGSACPPGWSEFAALRGRVVVGLPTNGVSEASVGSALGNQGTRSISNVVQHAHSVDPPTAQVVSNGANHSHSMSHTHGVNPPNTGINSAGAHTHNLRDGVNVGDGLIGVNVGGGGHPGVPNSSGNGAALNTTSNGSHSHSVDIAGFNSGGSSTSQTGSEGSAHAHALDITPFNSAPSGAAAVDVTMPYLQLLACQAP